MWAHRDFLGSSHFFELLECAVSLARPRVNERQIGNPGWAVERVLSNRLELNRAPATNGGSVLNTFCMLSVMIVPFTRQATYTEHIRRVSNPDYLTVRIHS
jgi:hypothetical protein